MDYVRESAARLGVFDRIRAAGGEMDDLTRNFGFARPGSVEQPERAVLFVTFFAVGDDFSRDGEFFAPAFANIRRAIIDQDRLFRSALDVIARLNDRERSQEGADDEEPAKRSERRCQPPQKNGESRVRCETGFFLLISVATSIHELSTADLIAVR